MKLLSLAIVRPNGHENATVLCHETKLNSFSYFTRGSAREFMIFLSRELGGRARDGQALSSPHKEYLAHVNAGYVRGIFIACVAITTEDYPERVAHGVVNKCLNTFGNNYSPDEIRRGEDLAYQWSYMNERINEYYQPSPEDTKFQEVEREIQNTTEIMHVQIDTLLKRGEKIEDLVDTSKDLSKKSKVFYKKTRKLNRCCMIM